MKMEWRGQQVVYGIVEVIATHHLMHYIKGHTPEDRTRMAAGVTMAGLGFVFGPELEERLRALPQTTASHGIRKEMIYAAGGATLGAVTAYLMRTPHAATPPRTPFIHQPSAPPTPATHQHPPIITTSAPPQTTTPYSLFGTTPPKAAPGTLGWRLERALADADPASVGFDTQHPGGLLTIASAAWLGYSLFFDGKTTEEQHRHLWGLGAGAVGYLYGPESLRWVKGLTISKSDGERAIDILRDGSVILGATIGGVAGYALGRGTHHA